MEDILKKVKLIIVDIDGTLTKSDKTISSYTKEVFEKAKKQGYNIVLCTGRPLVYAVEKSKLCSASNFVIADNGALIYDYANKNVIYESAIEQRYVRELFEFAEDNNMFYILNYKNGRYENKKAYYNEKYSKNVDKIKLINNVDDLNENFTQVVIECGNASEKENLITIIGDLKSIKINNSNGESDSFWCDINNFVVDKGNGIKILMKHLGYDYENVICFGDQWNDCSMFDICAVRVAMKNAVHALKEKADFITDTNDNDGVAKFIEEYLLK